MNLDAGSILNTWMCPSDFHRLFESARFQKHYCGCYFGVDATSWGRAVNPVRPNPMSFWVQEPSGKLVASGIVLLKPCPNFQLTIAEFRFSELTGG
jgi:hypothetical protein